MRYAMRKVPIKRESKAIELSFKIDAMPESINSPHFDQSNHVEIFL
jgi:hypothetical protein